MRSSIAILSLLSLFAAVPLSAQTIAYETVDLDAEPAGGGGERSLPVQRAIPIGERHLDTLAAYGPFRVLDEGRAALVDVTDGGTPGQFLAMLDDHPGIATIELIDCPGTEDDLANLRLGRMIRERGMATHVPPDGSVRSGGVEIFLAGARRYADPGAEFAVHSWMDDTGREAGDYSASAPENRRYIDYYRQMGMSPIEAEAFYAMTNSVPFASAKWFGRSVMNLWVSLEGEEPPEQANSEGPAMALLLDSPATLQ
jgi:Predicted periplasmic protein